MYQRVNFRRKLEDLSELKFLENEEEKKEYYNKIKFHFYTIISFSDTSKENSKIDCKKVKEHISSVSELIKKFDDEIYIQNNKKTEKNTTKNEQKLPYGSEILKKHMIRLNENLDCDTKIYYDLYWNKLDINSKKLYEVYYKENLINNNLFKEIEKYLEYIEMDN